MSGNSCLVSGPDLFPAHVHLIIHTCMNGEEYGYMYMYM